VAIALAGPTLYLALSNASLALYDAATLSRVTAVPLPAAPLALAALPHAQGPLAAVAMRDKAVLLFKGAVPVSRHETAARVLGLHGGALPLPRPIHYDAPSSCCRCFTTQSTVLMCCEAAHWAAHHKPRCAGHVIAPTVAPRRDLQAR
jgi:hypothetical protein